MESRDKEGSMATLAYSLIVVLMHLFAIGQQGALAQENEHERPVPRHSNGRVNFGPPPGEDGTWDASQSRLVVNPQAYDADSTRSAPVHINDIPIQEWAHALTNYRHSLNLASEPYTRCKPSGGPRQIMSPYGLEIVVMSDLQRAYIFTISNSMSYRVIYMDGREHPKDIRPTNFGHSVGHWEGDTLVVDTVGMNEQVWMNRDALPHTEQLHLSERFTRVRFDTLEYQVTIDDPGAYNEPWTSGYTLEWSPGGVLFEYICQENNLSPSSMLDDGLESRIVP